jgi:hypothetical protein
MNDKLIVIIYVDDILIYGRKGKESQIDDLIDELKREEVALHKEGTAEGYLGVDIKRDGNQVTLHQRGLTQRVIEALGLLTPKSQRHAILLPTQQPWEKMLMGIMQADTSTIQAS